MVPRLKPISVVYKNAVLLRKNVGFPAVAFYGMDHVVLYGGPFFELCKPAPFHFVNPVLDRSEQQLTVHLKAIRNLERQFYFGYLTIFKRIDFIERLEINRLAIGKNLPDFFVAVVTEEFFVLRNRNV